MMHADLQHDSCDSVAEIENGSGHRSIFRWLAALISRRRRAATRVRLDVLDDRMLRDVGLRRDQLTGNIERLSQSPHGPRFP